MYRSVLVGGLGPKNKKK